MLALAVVGCGDEAPPGPPPEVSRALTAAGPVTRANAPFTFEQVLRVESTSGSYLEQRTDGVYEPSAGRVALRITSEGDGAVAFSGSTVTPGTEVGIVIDGDRVLLRVDLDDVVDGSWASVNPGSDGPTVESAVSILGAALLADVNRAEVIGPDTVGGVSVTHYRIPAPAGDLAVYLPTETLDVLLDAGFRREVVDGDAMVDAWLDDEGRIRRLVVDYLPLIEAMVGRGLDEGSTVSAMTHTFTVVPFGEVSVEVPEIGEGSEEG